ncbi:MAG: asparaginase domain-containing protein [Chloroflexota bacterium]
MIKIFSTGGTIDKIYFDAKSEFQVGLPLINEIFAEAFVSIPYEVESIMRKDSLEIDDSDRSLIRSTIENDPNRHIIVTHGTDTMVKTGMALLDIPDKTIILVGAMQPARLRSTDAVFNVGFAVAAVQTLPEGIYIAMNAQIFDPRSTVKNVPENRFEQIA